MSKFLSELKQDFKVDEPAFVLIDISANGACDWTPCVIDAFVEEDWARVIIRGKRYCVPLRSLRRENPNKPEPLQPKSEWEAESLKARVKAIDDAIRRHVDSGFPIPASWIDERNELLPKVEGGK